MKPITDADLTASALIKEHKHAIPLTGGLPEAIQIQTGMPLLAKVCVCSVGGGNQVNGCELEYIEQCFEQ